MSFKSKSINKYVMLTRGNDHTDKDIYVYIHVGDFYRYCLKDSSNHSNTKNIRCSISYNFNRNLKIVEIYTFKFVTNIRYILKKLKIDPYKDIYKKNITVLNFKYINKA